MAIQRIRTDQMQSTSSSYDNFTEQLAGMSQPFMQTKIATEGQTYMSVDSNFTMGTGQLKVFVNGQYVESGALGYYVELSSSEIQFAQDVLVAGDVVTLRIEGVGGGATTADHVHYWNITPQGLVNGVNRVFQLSHYPRAIAIYINGIRQSQSMYTVNLNQVTLDEAPLVGYDILIDYVV